jgi:hypothetical protein
MLMELFVSARQNAILLLCAELISLSGDTFTIQRFTTTVAMAASSSAKRQEDTEEADLAEGQPSVDSEEEGIVSQEQNEEEVADIAIDSNEESETVETEQSIEASEKVETGKNVEESAEATETHEEELAVDEDAQDNTEVEDSGDRVDFGLPFGSHHENLGIFHRLLNGVLFSSLQCRMD